MAWLLMVVGYGWALLGLMNMLGMPWIEWRELGDLGTVTLSGGIIFNMVLFVLPGLGLGTMGLNRLTLLQRTNTGNAPSITSWFSGSFREGAGTHAAVAGATLSPAVAYVSCANWLREVLKWGPVPSNDIYRWSAENGFAKDLLMQVKDDLGIEILKGMWELPPKRSGTG